MYRGGNGFPVNASATDTNYYVDVMFVDGGTSSTPTVLSTNPGADAASVNLTEQPAATFSKSMDESTISFTLQDAANATVPGTTSYDDVTRTATFTPSANLATGTTYTASVTGSDSTGSAMAAPATWSFTTIAYSTTSTLFATDAVPQTESSGDTDGVTLGVKFTPTVSGQIVGIRYYQGAGNTGTHTGTLYDANGGELAKATFAASSGTGWKSVQFAAPIDVTAGTTYVAAYWAPNGNYSVTPNFFATAWTNSDNTMTAINGANGVYRYGSDEFPSSSFNSTNYWVDPLFIPGSTPTPPTQPTPPAGSQLLFDAAATPAVDAWDDSSSLEVGVKFSSTAAGKVHGVRFYKGPGNTGTHTGSLWGPDGLRIATGTFIHESETGWQTLLFETPISIVVGATYTVSYHTNVGFYSLTANQFASDYSRGPLQVPASGAVYRYGATEFPSSSSNHNYWVDVVFVPDN